MSHTFNGTNQHVRSAALASGVPMTIAAFFNQTASLAVNGGIASVSNSSNGHRNSLIVRANGTVRVTTYTASDGTTLLLADTTATAALNTWNHACGVFSSLTSRTIYLNGANAVTNTSTAGAYATADLVHVGAQGGGGGAVGQYFPGRIAEVGIWSAALTPGEVLSLSQGAAPDQIRPQDLVFYAPLVRDLVELRNGVTLTNFNGAAVDDHPRVYA